MSIFCIPNDGNSTIYSAVRFILDITVLDIQMIPFPPALDVFEFQMYESKNFRLGELVGIFFFKTGIFEGAIKIFFLLEQTQRRLQSGIEKSADASLP